MYECTFDDRMRMINDIFHHIFICSLGGNAFHAYAVVVVIGVFLSFFLFDNGHISHTQSVSAETAMLAIIHST